MMNRNALWNSFLKLFVQVGVALAVYAVLRAAGLYNFTAPENEGLNTVIVLLGSIYSVMFAFSIFVIWGQFTEVENLLLRECNMLDDLLRFGNYLHSDGARSVRRGVSDYVHQVHKYEWPALAAGHRDQSAERLFSELTDCVIQVGPATPAEEMIHLRLIDIVRKAGEHRDERVAKSLTRIPPTLVWLVRAMAAALLLLVCVYPFHHWLAGAGCLAIVALVLGLADFVMMDTDNPFEGVCNLNPKPFADLVR